MWPVLDWLLEAQGLDVSHAISVVLFSLNIIPNEDNQSDSCITQTIFFFPPNFQSVWEKQNSWSILKCDEVCQLISQYQ